jgi:hypothetical protein
MAISAHFRHTGFTPEKYDEAIRRLDAAGQGAPAGRLEHMGLETNGEIEVLDIWESQEALEAWARGGSCRSSSTSASSSTRPPSTPSETSSTPDSTDPPHRRRTHKHASRRGASTAALPLAGPRRTRRADGCSSPNVATRSALARGPCEWTARRAAR